MSRLHHLDFEIVGDFGEANPQDIREVLISTAESIWLHCPSCRWEVPGFHIFHSGETPIALYDHRPDGKIAIGVAIHGRLWAQLAFQFAHEFCHALVGHSNNWQEKQSWIREFNSNAWFEESLCETASLFALRAMAKSWKTAPPYPNWSDYGESLVCYAADRLSKTAETLPSDFEFYKWFKEHEPSMRGNSIQRELNNVVARELLPIFESAPESWETVAFYHAARSEPCQSLQERLTDWHRDTPTIFRPAICRIAAIFGLSVEPQRNYRILINY